MDDLSKLDKNGGDFWMVWNYGGRAPTRPHNSEESANTEAQRLARENPGCTFVVLQAMHGYAVKPPPPPPVERITLDEIRDEFSF